ncbi:MAG: DUF1993 domain-containing protein [Steroidobacteraceae bacterium]
MPAISMYRASVPVFTRLLKNLDVILDKAVVYADSKKIDHNALLTARLAPDMFHLIRQVQIATDNAKGCVARLADAEIPKYEDNEASFADLKARLAKTIAFLESFKPEQVDGTEDKNIVLKMGPNTREFKGIDYLLGHASMNVYFHVTTAYNILRHNGLEIGKKDFIG